MADVLHDVRPTFELGGRNYIVTGGAQGIGFAATRAICEMGGNVAVLDIQAKPVPEFETLSSKYNVKALYIQTDVTKEESLNAAFSKALDSLGSIDGCVPAAGIAIDKPFVEQTWDEFTRIQDINVSSCSNILVMIYCRAEIDELSGPWYILHCSACHQADNQAKDLW